MIVGIGMDIVEIERVQRLIDARQERALRRLFTRDEAEYALRRGDPFRHLAARIAAKEAAFKALAGTPEARGIGWLDIEVRNAEDGRPSLVLHRRANERATSLRAVRSLLTISHTRTTAGAVVVLEAE
jgi:holo-[acyl-carrier protein] synthase